jgi:hypothetical protein
MDAAHISFQPPTYRGRYQPLNRRHLQFDEKVPIMENMGIPQQNMPRNIG